MHIEYKNKLFASVLLDYNPVRVGDLQTERYRISPLSQFRKIKNSKLTPGKHRTRAKLASELNYITTKKNLPLVTRCVRILPLSRTDVFLATSQRVPHKGPVSPIPRLTNLFTTDTRHAPFGHFSRASER